MYPPPGGPSSPPSHLRPKQPLPTSPLSPSVIESI